MNASAGSPPPGATGCAPDAAGSSRLRPTDGSDAGDPSRPAPLRRALLGALALALLLLCGCAAGRVNLWPLYFHERRAVPDGEGTRTVETTEFLYPLFGRRSDPQSTWHAVRPLYNSERKADGPWRVQYLWPLGLSRGDPEGEATHRLFPLFGYYRTYAPGEGRHSTHWHLMQFVRGGNDAKYGPYAAVFPLAGVTHDVIAPTWSFLLFPLYSHYRHGEYVRDDFPWPFFGYGRTPDGRVSQYRFWPLYVHQRAERLDGLYERKDLLWPFLRWGRLDRGGEYYHTVFVAVPFYSSVKTWSRDGELAAYRVSVLGFQQARDFRDRKQIEGWSALWSLVKSSSGPRKETFRVIPFYWGTTRYASAERDPDRTWKRHRILWPFIWVDRDTRDPEEAHHAFILAPLYWHYTDRYPGEPERTARRVTLFPLATWESREDGGRHFWLLSHGWKDTTGGFKRNYRAFFDLFQYHSRGDGERETRLLSRLYHHRRGPRGRYLSLMGLFTYDSTAEVVGEEGSYFSLLFGLLRSSWTEEGRRWRLFYIPLGHK